MRTGKTIRFPIVYLPIEFQAREFESKALLADTLTRRGYTVVFGQHWMLYANIDWLPRGVFLFKSFNKIHQPAMLQAKRAGHAVVILEEELLAQIEEKAIVSMCAEGIFAIPDLILANGRFERDILKRVGGNNVRIEIVGNGRIDILKPNFRKFFEKQIEEIKSAHGDFILVNTNFAIRNSIWENLEDVTRIQLGAGFIKANDPASMRIWQDYVEFEDANLAAMHDAVRELSRRRPNEKIIIRPHPGESLKRWEGIFPNSPNVVVIREGAHIPWTLASRLLLHTSCTTGFEAFVAGKTALSLVPMKSWIGDSLISNQVNPIFENPRSLVETVEKILDGSSPPPDPPRVAVEDYVWNWAGHDGTSRIADLLIEALPLTGPIAFPTLQNVSLDERLRGKINVSLAQCKDLFGRIAKATGRQERLEIHGLGDSLFLVAPMTMSPTVAIPAKPDHDRIRAEIEGAIQARDFKKAHDIFRENFGEAYRHADLCYRVGIALFELGEYRLALQYFQAASVASSDAVNFNIAFALARTHQKLGEIETARRYAQLAYQQVPTEQRFFSLLRELSSQTGRKPPEHWLVIGCSHVRYFRYMQVNQSKFFDGAVHLECYEFGGATAFGLGNPLSESGALKATRQLQPRLAEADRVIVNFGEIDCRRAAWKAAATSGRSIDETIAESADHMEMYVVREILPFNKNILLLGAKPQIIADDDFYKNSLEDERTIFKPLAEREKITGWFNRRLRERSEALNIDYADIDDVLKDDASRRRFFDSVFWDEYTTDTHGNIDSIATLYFERVKRFAGRRRKEKKTK